MLLRRCGCRLLVLRRGCYRTEGVVAGHVRLKIEMFGRAAVYMVCCTYSAGGRTVPQSARIVALEARNTVSRCGMRSDIPGKLEDAVQGFAGCLVDRTASGPCLGAQWLVAVVGVRWADS